MAQHKTCEEEFGCVAEDVAIKVANLRYDEIADFLHQLERKFEFDSSADADRGRPLLSKSLSKLTHHIGRAAQEAKNTWEICKEHMEEKESSPP